MSSSFDWITRCHLLCSQAWSVASVLAKLWASVICKVSHHLGRGSCLLALSALSLQVDRGRSDPHQPQEYSSAREHTQKTWILRQLHGISLTCPRTHAKTWILKKDKTKSHGYIFYIAAVTHIWAAWKQACWLSGKYQHLFQCSAAVLVNWCTSTKGRENKMKYNLSLIFT